MKIAEHNINTGSDTKSARIFFQPKYAVNKPNDQFENEADTVAEQVMRMPVNKNDYFFKPVSVNSIQRKCAECEEEEALQRKEINDHQTNTGKEFESYVDNLNSGGNYLSKEAAGFFGPRFGYDFSNVRIHNDSAAAKSAQSINALAYTSGNNIVFNQNQYSPGKESGKKLLAHELTHVVQQSKSGAKLAINRKSEYKKTDPLENVNLAEQFVQLYEKGNDSGYFGTTVPLINGVDTTVASTKNPIKIPVESDLKSSATEDQFRCEISKMPSNVISYKMNLPSNDKNWKFVSDINRVNKAFGRKHCSASVVNVILSGDPDSATVYANVKTHEKVHADQIEQAHDNVIKPFDKEIANTGMNAKDANSCKKNFLSFIKRKADKARKDFVDKFTTLSNNFHGTPAGAKGKMGISDTDSDCNWIKVKAKV